jgi:hypothetical protein
MFLPMGMLSSSNVMPKTCLLRVACAPPFYIL